MIFKVFLRTIGIPFLWALVIFWPADNLAFRLFIIGGILVWLLIRLVFNKRNYLSGLSFVDDTVVIQFIAAPLFKKTLELNVRDISGMRLSEANFPYNYAGALRIHANNQWYSFLILDKKLYDMVEHEINTTHMAFVR